MRAIHNKSRTTYRYKGNLSDEVAKCEKELEELQTSQDRLFIKWQYEQAKKKYDSYERRISDLHGFIKLAKRELESKEE